MPLTALCTIETSTGNYTETMITGRTPMELFVSLAHQFMAVGESDWSRLRVDAVNAARSRDDMRTRSLRPFDDAQRRR